MTLELGAELLALASLLVMAPMVLHARATGAAHALLVGLAVLAGYGTLVVIFSADALMRQPLSPTLRFSRGFAAGIGAGLVLAGAAVAIYDLVTAPRSGNRLP